MLSTLPEFFFLYHLCNTEMEVFNGNHCMVFFQSPNSSDIPGDLADGLHYLLGCLCMECIYFLAESQESDTEPDAVGVVAVSKLSRIVAQD